MGGYFTEFDPVAILYDNDDYRVSNNILDKAMDLAMLGLPDECHAICKVLVVAGKFDGARRRLQRDCIWTYSDLQPPDIDQACDDAVWIPSESQLQKYAASARRLFSINLTGINLSHPSETTVQKLRQLLADAEEDQELGEPYNVSASQLSAAYVALISIAVELGLTHVIEEIAPLALSRIEAVNQASYLTLVPYVWENYFLPGKLRDMFDIPVDCLKGYAQQVREVAKERFDQGSRRPEALIPDGNLLQFLQLIDSNMATAKCCAREDFEEDQVKDRLGSDSILQIPATETQISASEQKLGLQLPQDLKDFYHVTNGCGYVNVGSHGSRKAFPPVQDLFFEDEFYMQDCPFELVPNLPYKLRSIWHGVTMGCIAMYEKADLDARVWILGPDAIKQSKDLLQKEYNKACDADREVIDKQIAYWYGTREVYDNMTEHCYYRYKYASGAQGVYPKFKSYVANVALESRPPITIDPIGACFDRAKNGAPI